MATLSAALGRATSILKDAEKPDARLEAEVLLMHLLGLSRAQLYSRWPESLNAAQESALEELVARRGRGEPLAYITAHREFFGLDLVVDRRVLIPRPETELLVESALAWLIRSKSKDAPVHPGLVEVRSRQAQSGTPRLIADVGTGSGAIAISLAFHCPDAIVYATDVSAEALEVARCNAIRHRVEDRVIPLQGDLLAPLPEPVDLLVANLPYVKEADLPRWCGAAQVELAWEPEVALVGGSDGLNLVRRLLDQALGYLWPGGALFMELGWGQGRQACELARSSFPEAQVSLHKDLAGLDRMVAILNPIGRRGRAVG